MQPWTGSAWHWQYWGITLGFGMGISLFLSGLNLNFGNTRNIMHTTCVCLHVISGHSVCCKNSAGRHLEKEMLVTLSIRFTLMLTVVYQSSSCSPCRKLLTPPFKLHHQSAFPLALALFLIYICWHAISCSITFTCQAVDQVGMLGDGWE